MQKTAFYCSAAHLPWLVLSIFLTVVSPNAAAACSVSEADNGRTLLVQNGQKKIAILGWQHPNELEEKTNIDNFITYIKQPAHSCEMAAELVNTVLVDEQELVLSSLDAYKRINNLPFMDANVTVGSEVSQMEITQREQSRDNFFNSQNLLSVYNIFDRAANDCPKISEAIAAYLLVVLNPENAVRVDYIRREHELKFRGLDDYQLRLQIVRESTITGRTFNPAKVDLPLPSRLILSTLVQRYKENFEAPSNEAIQNAITPIQNAGLKRQTLEYLRAMQVIAQTLQARNQKIVENIMSTPGNIVMLIGQDHYLGLKDEFVKMCGNQTNPSAPIVPTKIHTTVITKDRAG